MNQSRNLAALTVGDGIELQLEPTNWSVPNTPAVAAQASASKAAVAGVLHVCTGIFASIACAATAQTILLLRLRDSTTGAGNILWEKAIAVLAGDSKSIDIDDLAIPGVVGQAMTLEFAGAGVTSSQQSVTLTGYDLTQ